MVNILRTVAREHFGSESELRKQELPSIQEANRKAKAEEARKELARRNRKKFRSRLSRNLPLIRKLVDRLDEEASAVTIDDMAGIATTQSLIDD